LIIDGFITDELSLEVTESHGGRAGSGSRPELWSWPVYL